jgi:hypothetical protein
LVSVHLLFNQLSLESSGLGGELPHHALVLGQLEHELALELLVGDVGDLGAVEGLAQLGDALLDSALDVLGGRDRVGQLLPRLSAALVEVWRVVLLQLAEVLQQLLGVLFCLQKSP